MSFASQFAFSPFFTPEKLREHLARGLPVLLLDDASRENEADLVAAASSITLKTMAMMIREGSGIVCLCLTEAQVQQLDLPPMVNNNQSRYQTAFTVSIEARQGVTTGVSAQDRLTTIKTAIAPEAKADDLARPGHVFPLRANPGGLHARRGHTEGAVALSRWANLGDAGVLCELTNPDGTMAQGDQVTDFAHRHQLPILTLDDVIFLNQSEMVNS